MALKSTIYKAQLQIADMDRQLYADHALTLALHPSETDTDDPYLWLEDVQGERALAWVRERNAESEAQLRPGPGFETRARRILEVLDSRDRIPGVTRRGELVYNFWQDAAQPARPVAAHHAGRLPPAAAGLGNGAGPRRPGPQRGENWVWGGALCLGPTTARCLLSLSRGGADAVVVREFDTVDKRFVDGGFSVPEGQDRVDLDRRRHAVHRHRLRPRLADRFGLPAHHQALDARPAAGRRRDGVRRRAQPTCRRLRLRRPHARLRAHAASAASPASTAAKTSCCSAAAGAAGQAQRRVAGLLARACCCQLRSDWAVAGKPGRAAACWWPTPPPT
jgi:hypothetical protein